MISIINTTRGGIGITPTRIVPAGGTLTITPDEFKAALTTAPFQARMNAGHLIATEIFDASDPAEPADEVPVDPVDEVVVKSEREILSDRAAELGITVSKRMKLKTIRGKIAKAEARG